MIGRILVLCCLAGIVFTDDIHHEMSSIERLEVFHTSNENDVPEYEVVAIYWPQLQTRSNKNQEEIALEAFGENIKLNLNLADGILAGYKTPVYMAREGKRECRFDKYSNLMKDIHTRMYEDVENAATFVVSHEDGKKKIVGSIGAKYLAIKPLPERLSDHVSKKRRISGKKIPTGDNFHYHIIYKTPESKKSSEDLNLEASLKTLSIMSLERPSIVYPEILVVLDNDYYKKLGGNIWQAIPYLLAFWNGVDMKYRSLKNPSWRLNIAAIVIEEKPDLLTYVKDNIINSTRLEAGPTLGSSGDFFFRNRASIPVESYDLITTMTSKDLCSMNDEKTECEPGTLGVAYVGSACKVSYYSSQPGMSKLSLVHDEGAYDGIHTTAHELGHVFGARHDGARESCKTEDGFIMAAYPMLTKSSSHWSPCTIKEFDKFIDSNPTCLYNKPETGEGPPRLFPGKWLDANEQCKKLGAKKACNIDSTICTNLKCLEGSRDCRTMGMAAPDGTSCDDEKVCFLGRCVKSSSLI